MTSASLANRNPLGGNRVITRPADEVLDEAIAHLEGTYALSPGRNYSPSGDMLILAQQLRCGAAEGDVWTSSRAMMFFFSGKSPEELEPNQIAGFAAAFSMLEVVLGQLANEHARGVKATARLSLNELDVGSLAKLADVFANPRQDSPVDHLGSPLGLLAIRMLTDAGITQVDVLEAFMGCQPRNNTTSYEQWRQEAITALEHVWRLLTGVRKRTPSTRTAAS
jgi:hypothetical protein